MRLPAKMLAVLMGILLGAGPAVADGWVGFYVPSKPSKPPSAKATLSAGAATGICIREILAAQERHGIPNNLLLAIGLQEAGTRRNGHFTVWPFAVNAAGEGRLFDTRAAALAWIADRRHAGIASIDVGCMQINMRWHPEAFENAAEGFDARVNVDYAARFLKRLHARTGDWLTAAGSYHSFEPAFRDVYLDRLQRNIAAANSGLNAFAALARNAHGSEMSPLPDRQRKRTEEKVTIARATWGADLGGRANAGSSIYSGRRITPLLPQFSVQTSEASG